MRDLHGLDEHITGHWGEDSIREDEDGDINEDGGAHVHYWSNATGVLGERWCLDCDWLLMPDGSLIQ